VAKVWGPRLRKGRRGLIGSGSSSWSHGVQVGHREMKKVLLGPRAVEGGLTRNCALEASGETSIGIFV